MCGLTIPRDETTVLDTQMFTGYFIEGEGTHRATGPGLKKLADTLLPWMKPEEERREAIEQQYADAATPISETDDRTTSKLSDTSSTDPPSQNTPTARITVTFTGVNANVEPEFNSFTDIEETVGTPASTTVTMTSEIENGGRVLGTVAAGDEFEEVSIAKVRVSSVKSCESAMSHH
ncbi:hypothetical protein B0A55_11218 [Friedmanniomyces simplex]|uniref:Uncharacterized protein n=1 Tax=Friedmanniomyces simplex TaxID=329884 RepID=A0A4U0WFK5_9PEZI|nr:hypothetical protein B0A55_11218 [Friedmanniomyces simplex]